MWGDGANDFSGSLVNAPSGRDAKSIPPAVASYENATSSLYRNYLDEKTGKAAIKPLPGGYLNALRVVSRTNSTYYREMSDPSGEQILARP